MKLALTLVVVFTATIAAATLPQTEDELAQVGEETTERVCSDCHPVEEVTGTRRTARDWEEMVAAMANRGATATNDELAIVKRYLARYYGLVRVNSAPAQEFSGVLGVTAEDAERIVAHRQAHGRFSEIGALLNVPGIDRTKIEAQPEALRFD